MTKLTKETQARKRAYNQQDNKDNYVRVTLRVHKKTASDVLAWLDTKESKQGYIIDLIRKDITQKKER